MTVYNLVILACWLVFLAVWAIAAFGAKPSLNRRHYWWLQGGVRLAILLAALLSLRSPSLRRALRDARPELITHSPAAGAIGAVLCVAGVGLAIWARAVLGRNWGMPMTSKQNPELVTSGPYAVIRHPIYSGILLAILGSVVGVNLFWLLPLILCAVYFIYGAKREEKLMAEQFPAQYPAYMKRTKMLLPFIF